MTADLPCICSQVGTRIASEGKALRVVDLSSSGVKIKPHLNRIIKTDDDFFENPILLAFHLRDKGETFVQKTAYARHICENYIGAEFDNAEQEDPAIGSYILSQRQY